MVSSKENIFHPLNLSQNGWKYYKIIKKKAMNHAEEEFSMSGLFFSLFIAFFICLSSATALSMMNYYLEAKLEGNFINKGFIQQTSHNQFEIFDAENNSKRLNGVNLALFEVKKNCS